MSIKKLNSISFVLIGLSLLMIFSGCVSSFIIGLREDQAQVMARMDDVSNSFEEFSTEVSLFEEQRDTLYEGVLSNFYYETMFQEDTIVKNKLSNYEALVNEIDKKRNSLDKLCSEVYYPDSAINSKCVNYKSIYEQVINYFVTDINYYNKTVNSYNSYAKSLGNPNVVSNYKTKKTFIDYNKDGKYDGRDS